MSREILKDIIEDFQAEKFIRLFRVKNNKFRYPNEPLPYEEDNFQEATKIAEVNLEDGNLIVCSFLVKKHLSERSGKKAQYELGKKILKESQTDAGIFIFYDAQGNFRFSLIYTDYLGRRRDWSNFRRFTYFVNKELTNKTFLQRIGEGDLSSLEKIKEAFSVEKVTKEFYQEIANWYFWAVQESKFPEDAEKEENGRNIAVIRLITRMIFIWFMQVRNLIPDELFNINKIKEILKDVSFDEATYYKAILQNLFFATLNARQKERKFRSEIRGYKGFNPDFGNHNVYRHHALFKDPERMREYFENIPFLNGGLFDCLDYKSKKKEERFYIDGFTDTKQYQPSVPNFLFFTEEKNVDLNQEYGTKGKRYKVRGLINILSSYNFTIDENEPDDLEVALDPELLGRVFENLLASYNPETATTARKATGSYNTPRETVDYMVTQSLINYFKTHLNDVSDIDTKLSELFSKENLNNPFDKATTKRLISLIESLRIVDPAVGSGAFPMGILNKLVFILSKVDPENTLWKRAQIEAINRDVKDETLKEKLITQAEEYFKTKNTDYLRKLYLIEKCIYGVDIQQIAVEIAKLRFFISLLVDEEIDRTKENWGIEPLPNLDFKLMQGNSLISSFARIDFGNKENSKDQFLFKLTTRYDELIKQFEDTKNQYQNEPDKNKKDKLREKIEELILLIFEEKLKERLPELRKIEESASQIPNLKHRKDYITAEKQKLAKKYGFDFEEAQKELIAYTEGRKPKNFFLWDVYFAEAFAGRNPGFDIAIGNPPYFSIDPKLKRISRQDYRYLKNNYKSFNGLTDIMVFFYEKSLDLLKNNGILAFISKNRWYNSASYKSFQNYLVYKNIFILDFDDTFIFGGVGVTTNIILIMKNKKPEVNYQLFDNSGLSNIFNFSHYKKYHFVPILNTTWNLMVDSIVKKMMKSGSYILYGGSGHKITPGDYFKLIKIGDSLVPEKTSLRNKVGELNFNKQEKTYIFPFASSGDIFPYCLVRKNRFIFNLYGADLNQLPNIRKYFMTLKKERSKNRWYEYHNGQGYRNIDIISKQRKIVFPKRMYINRKSSFYLDEDSIVIGMDCGALISQNLNLDLRYILSILNSGLMWYYIRKTFKRYANRQTLEIEKLPIIEIPIDKQQPFIEIVDKILSITQLDDYLQNSAKQAQVKEYERQIDQMVYELYELTKEEIKIVENFRQ